MIINRIVEGDDVLYSFRDITESDLDWKNFSCIKRSGSSFQPGHPNFNIKIPEDLAFELRDAGVNVIVRDPRDVGGAIEYQVNVKINLDYYRPPEVYIRDWRGEPKHEITKENSGTLRVFDEKDIVRGEVMARLAPQKNDPSKYSLYATIFGAKLRENPFDAFWADDEHPED